ncbi:MAG TPA: hypothetical protein VFH95_10065 [Candidatus Kapabacteria bacterium]|nr:hypothetical protein [Candidatus Kapabacteria bacterium]
MPRSIFIFLVLLVPCALRAQLLEGLQLTTQPIPSGSRGMAMGGSLISAAEGIDALDFNPAAIAPIASHEITFSIFNRDHASTADFFGTSSTASLNAMSLSSLGIAAPFPTTQGHAAMGISYDRVRDYTSSYSFKAVNPNSSYFNTRGFLQDQGTNPTDASNGDYLDQTNLAYALGLTYGVPTGGPYTLTTPFTGGLEQSGTVTTEGGLNAIRIGGGIDIAEGISAGATVNILFGSYDYTMNYQEKDVNGIFANDTGTLPPDKFQQANILTTLHQDQSGGSIKFGLLVKRSILNFGITVETPEAMHISENSQQTGTSSFGPNGTLNSDLASALPIYAQEYDVTTPFRLGAGASIHLLGLTGSAGVSYVDMSQLRFSNGTFDMSALNTEASDSLRGVLSYQLGAEYVLPLGISIRAGYSFEPSPYKGDPTNYGVSAISGGLGFDLSSSVSLEAAMRHASYHTNHAIYNDLTPQGTPASANIYDDAVTRDDVSVTFSYRY